MKIALAYSGGLDTSVAIKWLKEKYGASIICVYADVGQGEDILKIDKRAIASGASKVYVSDLKEKFINEFVFPALKAGAVYEKGYLLATALSRPLIVWELARVAVIEKCGSAAHGCTGKGNDQVRFEVGISTLAPHLEVIAPVREWELGSRDEEIEYAKEHGIPVDVTKKSPYSIDRNLWGISIEAGVLEDPWKEPPEDAYQITKSPQAAPNKPAYLVISFEKGVPVKLDGKRMKPSSLICKVAKIGGAHGVGRVDMVENRLVGIKSHEIYELPAATILNTAHKELEGLVLDRETAHYKELVSQKYSELVYYGLWYTPLKKALDAFVNETQKYVTGDVRVKLYKGTCAVAGRKSPYSLYNYKLATYDKGSTFDQKLAKGFIELWGLPYKIRAQALKRNR
ncbi:argininosuccinate synthase [Candidatus Desantisbacteria bacterium CG_4_10_14_0_8_um_filter_48_22]|uniref:Argininosuccinate synthase n=1 Tax=Candidatus Desantisbacteria bacterium CG_4_10_14_0_8_um_filter_48_22 TaxID=1974543 RepID=A0A2M7S9C7_9BACT|nr:MAG: argininosuccinate synthase [Candidatus Desantisbacteria bacterium CG1_02_49_89]PIZ16080.1 MAG: argininosuccinate synthase [Candidatus Desantisbacteria bacterium CG_4_10_14_0_8_um_filter_48_22]